MFAGKSQFEVWGVPAFETVGVAAQCYREVRSLVDVGAPATPSQVEDLARCLAAIDDERRAHQHTWRGVAAQDKTYGGAFFIFDMAAYGIVCAAEALWASHVVATAIPDSEDAANARAVAEGLYANCVGNADQLMRGGGRCKVGNGQAWAMQTIGVITGGLLGSVEAEANNLGGVPEHWSLPV